MNYPKLSIITINLNNKQGLEKTIESISKQSFNSYEHILIDGESTDGSKERINKYSKENSKVTYWISEKDSGIYNAMNKGIEKAQGEYLLFLNSGDYLEEDILNRISHEIADEDIIYGNLNLISENGEKRLQQFPSPPFSASQVISPNFYLPHPATFIKRQLFDSEKYIEKYKIISDGAFFLRCILLRGCTFKHISSTISNFIEGGISNNEKSYSLTKQERDDFFANLLSPILLKDINELILIKESPLYESICKTANTQRFQRRANRFILLCYKIRSLFKSHSRKQ